MPLLEMVLRLRSIANLFYSDSGVPNPDLRDHFCGWGDGYDAPQACRVHVSFSERRMASSQRKGIADPETFHRVNFVGPMCGTKLFIASTCGSLRTKSCKVFSSSQTESVQKLRLRGFARSE